MDNVRNRLRLQLLQKDDVKKVFKQQSKLTFNGNHKTDRNCDSLLFRMNEVLMDKLICLELAILELSKLHMYGTYYDKLKPYCGLEIIQLLFVDTDSFVLSMKTKDTIKDLKNLKGVFDFSNTDENHELFGNRNKKEFGKFKKETLKKNWIDEFIC